MDITNIWVANGLLCIMEPHGFLACSIYPNTFGGVIEVKQPFGSRLKPHSFGTEDQSKVSSTSAICCEVWTHFLVGHVDGF